jgi:hypothetical protein
MGIVPLLREGVMARSDTTKKGRDKATFAIELHQCSEERARRRLLEDGL